MVQKTKNIIITVFILVCVTTNSFCQHEMIDQNKIDKINVAFKKLYLNIQEVKVDNQALILEGKFDELESTFKSCYEKYLADPSYEFLFLSLTESLNNDDPKILKQLNKWVQEKPSYISYGVRGRYKVILGYNVRGGGLGSRNAKE